MQYKQYGGAPEVVAEVKLEPSEFCYTQYMPIAFPRQGVRIPRNLHWTLPLLAHVPFQEDEYVYLTAKHFYTKEDCCNRGGWHSDGFGTDDINYIWYDAHPTEFCVQEFTLRDDHLLSMIDMDKQAEGKNIYRYPPDTLLRLDEKVIHRVSTVPFEGLRTFVKISVSKHKYNLKGNAHNPMFDYEWDMVERMEVRNHPIGELI